MRNIDFQEGACGQNLNLKLSEHILNRALTRRIPIAEDGYRLNNSEWFEHGVSLAGKGEELSNRLFEELTGGFRFNSRTVKQRDFNILSMNLLKNEKRTILALPMNQHLWTVNRYRKAGQFVPRAIRLLVEHEIIGIKKGEEIVSRVTRIWPKKPFLDRFAGVDIHEVMEYRPVEFVVLRDAKKHDVDYKDTPQTIRIRRILERNYNVTNNAGILDHNGKKVFTGLRAIFRPDWQSGGRLYTLPRKGYQSFSKTERSRITIGGEATVELDFSGMQINMLYAWKRIQLDKDRDPYLEVFPHPGLRSFLKTLFLALINAKSDVAAIGSGNYGVHQECKRGDFNSYGTLKRLGVTVKDLVLRFEEHHKDIVDYFYSGIAHTVMNYDSKIALMILDHFGKKNVPILAIHDSFIVQERYRDELWGVMDESYRAVMGGFTCRIK